MGRWGDSRLGALLACVAAACAGHDHVRLEAPPRSAPFERRLLAYEKLRPQPRRAYLGQTFDTLELEGEREVHHPEDILPVVPRRSVAAHSARRSASLRTLSSTLLIGGLAVFLVSSAAIGVGWAEGGENIGDPASPAFLVVFSGLSASVILMAASAIPESTADDAASLAYERYDPALRRRLDLCVANETIVDCAERRQAASVSDAQPEPGAERVLTVDDLTVGKDVALFDTSGDL